MNDKIVVVWDIGKTNAKLCALGSSTGEMLDGRQQEFGTLPGPPYSHIDAGGLWKWFKEGLANLADAYPIQDIVVTAHGATAALVDGEGLVLPILDYEDAGPDSIESEYSKLRPPFEETLSPSLPAGLNYGKGLYWLSRGFAGDFERARHALSYVQYWTWRLSGVAATECTTIGSHSDLWNAEGRSFSALVGKMGWERLFPPIRRADEVLGPIKPDLSRELGVPADCRIRCGIHDSNASLLPWLSREAPFTVSSTGTWVINFSIGANLGAMDPSRDCAANVSMYGDPIACSRWMGGREFANICGEGNGETTPEAIEEALGDESLMVLPNQGGQGGPFIGLGDSPTGALGDASAPVRVASACLYCAMMLDVTLDLCDTKGDVIVEGSFARNPTLLGCVAAVRDNAILVSDDNTGTTAGAARLVLPGLPGPKTTVVEPRFDAERMVDFRDRWRSKVC